MIPFDQRLAAIIQLGRAFDLFGWKRPWPGFSCGLSEEEHAAFERAITEAGVRNAWFTDENVCNMLRSLSIMLREGSIGPWSKEEHGLNERQPLLPQRVGVIMAGNIPMVGFHDLLCVLLSGHHAHIKLSSQDNVLIPAVIDLLDRLVPGIREQVTLEEGRLSKLDAVIATGSTNTGRYFEHYFGHLPRIIRKGRVSVAVLDGTESEDDLRLYAEDALRYFGLGCRNVSKLYIPRDFDLDRFFKAIQEPWQGIVHHSKWANNYTYDRALWLLDQVSFLDNGFILLKEDRSLASPVAALHFERYDDRAVVLAELEEQREGIQCIVGRGPGLVPPGNAQLPEVWDYADGVDTMAFLSGLGQGQNS